MKWLTFVLCLLAVNVNAQELKIPEPETGSPPEVTENPSFNMPQATDPDMKVIVLPFNVQCTTVAPDELLGSQYGELGFIEGDGQIFKPNNTPANGKMRMFMNPELPRTFTIMLELSNGLSCMVLSGTNATPMTQSDGI